MGCVQSSRHSEGWSTCPPQERQLQCKSFPPCAGSISSDREDGRASSATASLVATALTAYNDEGCEKHAVSIHSRVGEISQPRAHVSSTGNALHSGSNPGAEVVAPLTAFGERENDSVFSLGASTLHSHAVSTRFGEVSKVTTNILRALAAIKGPPLEQLKLSVDVLSEIIGIPFVSITVFSEEPVLTSTVVAVSPSFAEAARLGMPVVVEQPEDVADIVTSTHHLLGGEEFLEACSALKTSLDSTREYADLDISTLDEGACQWLPSDWQVLSQATDLHSFAAVPITDGGSIVGQLTVGDHQDVGACCSGTSLGYSLEVAAAWMSQWLGEGSLPDLASMLYNIASAGDMEALVQTTCTGLQEYFKKRMHLKLRVRVALLDSPDSAVVYEEQPTHTSKQCTLETTQSADCSFPPEFRTTDNFGRAEPVSPEPRRRSTDLHSRLRSIHNSTAVSSLEDLRNLTQTITSNEAIREQLLPSYMNYVGPSSLGSGLNLLAPPSPKPATGLTSSSSWHTSSNPMNVSSHQRANGGNSASEKGSPADLPPNELPPSPSAVESLLRAPCPKPSLLGPLNPLTPGGPNFLIDGCVPRAKSNNGLQELRQLSTTSCHLPKMNSSRGDLGPALSRCWSFTNPNASRSSHSTSLSSFRGKHHLINSRRVASEDVLLQMVQDADEQDDTTWQLVAHTMSSLERTLLAQVLSGKQQCKEGTWIKDVATYMMQPNRPGRDIVVSARSPPVASLVLACLPSSAPSASSTSTIRVCSRSSSEVTACASASTTSATSAPQVPRLSAKDSQQHIRHRPCTMATYLASASSLVPLQLQAILRELQLVLSLMHPSVSMHMYGELREEWLRARGRMLCRKSTNCQGSLLTGFGSSSRLCRTSFSSSQVSAPFVSTSPKLLGQDKDASKLWYADPQLGAAHSETSGSSSLPVSPIYPGSHAAAHGTSALKQNCCKRSFTHYSQAVEAPQVAPLVFGLQAQLCSQLVNPHHMELFNNHKDLGSLKVCEFIARGGFSTVYKGLWQGLEVAIKVVPQRKDHSDSVREAVELAVMSTVSHPNMLGVQNFWVDVLVTPQKGTARWDTNNGLLKLESGISSEHQLVESKKLAPDLALTKLQVEQQQQQQQQQADKPKLSLVIVMELSDQGSLDKAITQGWFWLMLSPSKPPCLNMLSILTTLLEIAMALRHMHSMQLVHCDLKPGNVLLKSSLTDSRGFTIKLADFGLCKFRYEAVDFTEQLRRSTFTGTVTHSPPEMLQGDPNPDYAYDIFAFGILMYEIVSLTPVYAGLTDRQVAQQVVYYNLRPTFPKRLHPEYVGLAKQCWSTDPRDRPTSAQVVCSISRMLMALRNPPAVPLPSSPPPTVTVPTSGMPVPGVGHTSPPPPAQPNCGDRAAGAAAAAGGAAAAEPDPKHGAGSSLGDRVIKPNDLKGPPEATPPPVYDHLMRPPQRLIKSPGVMNCTPVHAAPCAHLGMPPAAS